MIPTWTTILGYTSIPAILLVIGGISTFFKSPGPKFSSTVQHFAAGVVIAAVAAELVPVIMQHEIRWITALGFAAGVSIMLLTEQLAARIDRWQEDKGAAGFHAPITLIIVVGIDVFIDGILVGVSFLANTRSGIIIALALALETLFLGITTAATMRKQKVAHLWGLLIISILGLCILVGAALGFGLVSGLSYPYHLGIISFGTAALLYLVAEELLREAHEVPETKIATVSFFFGFLLVLLVT